MFSIQKTHDFIRLESIFHWRKQAWIFFQLFADRAFERNRKHDKMIKQVEKLINNHQDSCYQINICHTAFHGSSFEQRNRA